MAARLRGDAGGLRRTYRETHGQQRVLHLDGGSTRRNRGAHRPAGRGEIDGGGVSPAPRSDRRRAERDRWDFLSLPEGGILRLSQYHRYRHEEQGIRRFLAQRARRCCPVWYRLWDVW